MILNVLLIIGIAIGYLMTGAVIGGLIQRWNIAPREFATLSVIAWPMVIGLLAVIYIALLVWDLLEKIMDKIEGN